MKKELEEDKIAIRCPRCHTGWRFKDCTKDDQTGEYRCSKCGKQF